MPGTTLMKYCMLKCIKAEPLPKIVLLIATQII